MNSSSQPHQTTSNIFSLLAGPRAVQGTIVKQSDLFTKTKRFMLRNHSEFLERRTYLAKLEELTKGAQIKGIIPGGLVSVVDIKWHGSDIADVTTRREFINALKQEMPASLEALKHANIAATDLAQAAIGPGMAKKRSAEVQRTDRPIQESFF